MTAMLPSGDTKKEPLYRLVSAKSMIELEQVVNDFLYSHQGRWIPTGAAFVMGGLWIQGFIKE